MTNSNSIDKTPEPKPEASAAPKRKALFGTSVEDELASMRGAYGIKGGGQKISFSDVSSKPSTSAAAPVPSLFGKPTDPSPLPAASQSASAVVPLFGRKPDAARKLNALV